jgi:hypothetical protein
MRVYETRQQRPLSFAAFRRRFIRHAVLALSVLVVSLGLGILGYHEFEHLSVTDGFLNSAMLLGGMGPVDFPRTESGKIFAALYALYSGIVFLAMATILVAPFLHRILHRFHWSEKP